MRRKLIYIVLFILLSAAILVPVINGNKLPGHNQAPDSARSSAFDETAGPEAVKEKPEDGSAKGKEQKVAAIPAPSPGLPRGDGRAAVDTAAPENSSPGNAGPDNRVTAPEQSGGPSAAAGENGCKVDVAVMGAGGELLYGPVNVTLTEKNTWDITALGALEATGLNYTLSSGGPSFVEAVAGQRNQGQSGWMYMVNNEIPMLAADQKILKAGDKVLWWYSRSIEDPLPVWDGLR